MLLLLFVAIGDFSNVVVLFSVDIVDAPFGIIMFVIVETLSSLSDAAAASDEFVYALVDDNDFVGDVRIFFVADGRIFFSFPFNLSIDDEDFLLSLALFLILSLLLNIIKLVLELFFSIFGFRGFVLLPFFWFTMLLNSPSMLFELRLVPLLRTVLLGDVASSPDDAVDVPMIVGDNKPFPLQLSQ
jgi:hypothetical protein